MLLFGEGVLLLGARYAAIGLIRVHGIGYLAAMIAVATLALPVVIAVTAAVAAPSWRELLLLVPVMLVVACVEVLLGATSTVEGVKTGTVSYVATETLAVLILGAIMWSLLRLGIWWNRAHPISHNGGPTR